MSMLPSFVLFSCLTLPLFAQDPRPPVEPPPPPAPTEKPAEKPAEKPVAKPKVLELGARIDGTLSLPDIDGKPQLAHELMGKVTVVNFYSIQCPIQAAWDSRLAEIQKDFAAQGVTFLHIDSNATEIGAEPPKVEGEQKPYENIRAHLAAKELPFRVLVDHGNKVADLFAATSTPHVYVFGKDGKLVYKGLVDDDQRNAKPDGRQNHLRDVLGKLVKDEKVEPFATKEVGCSIKRAGAGGGQGGRRPRGEGRRGGGGQAGGNGGERGGD